MPGRWTVKPPYGTPIDRSHPWAQGLAGFWPLNEGAAPFYDAVSGQSFAGQSGTVWTPTPHGIAARNASNGLNPTATLSRAVAAPYSATAIYQVPASGLCAVVSWRPDTLSGLWVTGTTVGVLNDGGGFAASWTVAGHTAGAWAVAAVTLTGTAAGSTATLCVNGVPQGSPASTTGVVSAPTGLTLGCRLGSAQNILATPIVACAIHSRLLSAGEAQAIGATPGAIWQVFRPRHDPLSIFGAAAPARPPGRPIVARDPVSIYRLLDDY